MDLFTLKMAVEKEAQYNRESPYRDYGIDLEDLI